MGSRVPCPILLGQLLRRLPVIGSLMVAGCAPRAQRELELHDVAVVQMPPLSAVRGANVNADGDVIVWTDSSVAVFGTKSGSITIVCPNSRRLPVAAAFAPHGAIEVVDSVSSTVGRRTADGECANLFRVAGNVAVVSGVRLTMGWVLGVVDSLGRQGFVGVDSAGEHGWEVWAAGVPGDPRMSAAAQLTLAAPNRFVATSIRWPFSWISYGWGSVGSDSGSFLPIAKEGVTSAVTPRWAGLPTIALDSGFLQVLADPSSDARILVRYDEHGKPERASLLDGALGMMSSLPSARLVVGLRRTDRLEVVVYGWGWRRRR